MPDVQVWEKRNLVKLAWQLYFLINFLGPADAINLLFARAKAKPALSECTFLIPDRKGRRKLT